MRKLKDLTYNELLKFIRASTDNAVDLYVTSIRDGQKVSRRSGEFVYTSALLVEHLQGIMELAVELNRRDVESGEL